MPAQRRCLESGALIFDLTNEEKAAIEATEDIKKIKEENAELWRRIERLEALVSNKGG